MKTISLTRGLVAVVDDSDFEKIGGCKWFAEKTRSGFYASETLKKKKVVDWNVCTKSC
jgi:hypothetical protein